MFGICFATLDKIISHKTFEIHIISSFRNNLPETKSFSDGRSKNGSTPKFINSIISHCVFRVCEALRQDEGKTHSWQKVLPLYFILFILLLRKFPHPPTSHAQRCIKMKDGVSVSAEATCSAQVELSCPPQCCSWGQQNPVPLSNERVRNLQLSAYCTPR